MKGDKESVVLVQSPKPRKPRNREVSSRFLAPSSETGISSPKECLSPIRRKPSSNSTDVRKTRGHESGSTRGQLWPSSSPAAISSSAKKKNLDTLADHLGNDRLKEYLDRKNEEKSAKSSSAFSLSRQRSCSETLNRLENDRTLSKLENDRTLSKENHRPSIGGSMRYPGKFNFPGKSSPSSFEIPISNESGIVPGRLSVDECALYRKSLKKLDSFTDSLDLGSDSSDAFSGSDLNSPAAGRNSLSSRKSGIEVPSKYMNNLSTRHRKLASDSDAPTPSSSDNSSILKKFTIKNAIKRANSLTDYKSSKSQWALSPGRSGSPPMSVESKEKVMSFSSLKPPTSPSRAKGVEKLLNMGLDFFKGMKSFTNSSSSSSRIITSSGSDASHHLRLLDNRLLQWRYASARAENVNQNNTNQAESHLLCASDSLRKLRHSVLQKKIQYEKEKLEMKLDFILYSQIKLLEAWGDMERQHISAINTMKESLHSIVCKVPLVEGASVDIQSTSLGLRQTSDLIASIKSMLNNFSFTAVETATLLSELAKVVAEEKLLIEEFYDLFQTMSTLESWSSGTNSNCEASSWKQDSHVEMEKKDSRKQSKVQSHSV